MIEGAVYSDSKVAVRYHQPVPKYVKIGGKEYVCDVKHGVSMLLVEESEVPALLAVEGGCCGGKKKVFSLCGQEAFNVWSTGHR
jgi:hypothetical protein